MPSPLRLCFFLRSTNSSIFDTMLLRNPLARPRLRHSGYSPEPHPQRRCQQLAVVAGGAHAGARPATGSDPWTPEQGPSGSRAARAAWNGGRDHRELELPRIRFMSVHNTPRDLLDLVIEIFCARERGPWGLRGLDRDGPRTHYGRCCRGHRGVLAYRGPGITAFTLGRTRS